MKRAIALIAALLFLTGSAAAERRWVMCRSYVNIRLSPDKGSAEVGRLDSGEWFETDGQERNGFIRAIGVGDFGEGWIFAGYTVEDEPERTDTEFTCVAVKRVACRKWTDGPRIKGKTGWLYNGTDVMVYWRTGEWSLTSRGYIRSEWLEETE